jgi:hypothetical protein
MKRRLLAIVVINLFLLTTILSVAPTHAQSSAQWITNYTISDLKTGQILKQIDLVTGQNNTNAPILAGAELNVTITIQVTTTSPNTNLQLSTNMAHSTIQGTYWELQTKTYAGISGSTYNPNQQTVSFSQMTGTLTMSCYGAISAGITQTQAGGITLDKKVDQALITLTDPVGNQLDKIGVSVVDAKINQFDTLLGTALNAIQTMKNNGVDPAYISLFQSVVDSGQSQANQGLVDNGITTLTGLTNLQTSSAPASTSTPIEATLFLPAVIALAVIVVIVGFMFVRTRGKVNYDKLVIEDQIKDLEGLTLRAAKIDKNLTVSLESVKDRLKSLVGA